MNPKGSICTVDAIKDLKQINDMKEYLFDHNRKIHLMFVLGINSGLRVSDLLMLTVDIVTNGTVTIREKKTQKAKQFNLSETCIKTIKEYLEYAGVKDGLLFPRIDGGDIPITKQWVWTVLNRAADYCGIKENVGTHTMRKIFGYLAYRNGVSVGYLQSCFNHSSEAITLRYIGITQEELNEKVYSIMNY